MKVKNLSVFFSLFCFLNGIAQQEPLSNMFWNNTLHFNPAISGLNYKQEAHATWKNNIGENVKNQFTYPKQQTIFANYSLRLEKIKSGVGILYNYDAFGNGKINTAMVTYAYHLPVKNATLSFGTALGIKHILFETKYWTTPTAEKDPLLNLPSGQRFSMDLGINYKHKKLNIGISSTQFNYLFFKSKSGLYNGTAHFWLFTDYQFNISNNWKLIPRLRLVTDRVKITSLLDLSANFKEKLWFGIGTRALGKNDLAFTANLGYDFLKKYRVGYSYTEYFNFSNSYQLVPNHEVTLGFLLK